MRIAVAGGTGTVGRHLTDLARSAGLEPVVIGRSTGIDLLTGAGLPAALAGVDAVIDVVNTPTLSAKASRRFFGTTTTTLLNAEADAGVRHHLALSIVNAATVSAGYYAGKALQEERVMRGAVPWTLLRATQFHEFAAQTLAEAQGEPWRWCPSCAPSPLRRVRLPRASSVSFSDRRAASPPPSPGRARRPWATWCVATPGPHGRARSSCRSGCRAGWAGRCVTVACCRHPAPNMARSLFRSGSRPTSGRPRPSDRVHCPVQLPRDIWDSIR